VSDNVPIFVAIKISAFCHRLLMNFVWFTKQIGAVSLNNITRQVVLHYRSARFLSRLD